ncbi:PAS domain-containing protein [Streptomyces sp. MUM 203J]|uniref:PAS domain-containing protein n=1 Tax=Streptomyces sp. MUM 203J TaxID=2791990 RepID=UPI0027E5391B|nr:PAS domain-containing protein [Streptomyces sp. MUM 203J]MCH0541004.1 PAS domain-containing protein [Streptomyces sp. MUM 203J]
MADPDCATLFAAAPSPYLVLGSNLVIAEVNRACPVATGRTREELLGRYLSDAFSGNPADPDADGVRNLNASPHRVLLSREPDTMALHRHDIPVTDRPGTFEERWWPPFDTPIPAPDGTAECIIHRVEDVTAFIRSRASGGLPPPTGPPTGREALEAELYAARTG